METPQPTTRSKSKEENKKVTFFVHYADFHSISIVALGCDCVCVCVFSHVGFTFAKKKIEIAMLCLALTVLTTFLRKSKKNPKTLRRRQLFQRINTVSILMLPSKKKKKKPFTW